MTDDHHAVRANGSFYSMHIDGAWVESYQTDLVAIVGNLGGEFRFGISEQGHVASIISDLSCHDVDYEGELIHNTVSAVLELCPLKDGREMMTRSVKYERHRGAYVPVVKARFVGGVTGEYFATTDAIGWARYTGQGVSSRQDPRICIRNHVGPEVYLRRMECSHRTGTRPTNSGDRAYHVDVFRMEGDDWGPNRALVVLKEDGIDEHNVLFAFTTFDDAEASVQDMLQKIGRLDRELNVAKRHYARIMREKRIDVCGTFIRHLERIVETYDGMPQRLRIDGKPACTWGEQVDQLAIPLSTIREMGENINEQRSVPAPTRLARLYQVGELVEVMHFFPALGSFMASLTFDVPVASLPSTDARISYTASAGYGGLEWPGRDGAHIAGDLVRDGWHSFGSSRQLYRMAWPLVRKLATMLEKKMGPDVDVPWSFCPWENNEGYLSYVGIEVVQGLRNAAIIADKLGSTDMAERWRSKAATLRRKILDRFWNDDGGYFMRMAGDTKLDTSPNMSAINSGFLDLSDTGERLMARRILTATVSRVAAEGGILRMEDENYIGRNPWFVCTGQYVQALISVAAAETHADEQSAACDHRHEAGVFLDWIRRYANAPGTYGEQRVVHQSPRTDPGYPVPKLPSWALLPWSEVEVRKAIIAWAA